MAFAPPSGARHFLCPALAGMMTTLQASLHVADCHVVPPRFDAGISADAGGFATGDLGVSPDRTCTGWSS
jgi:hypothetical protein